MRGLILYGPPTSGKDTVTAALARRGPRYQLVPKVKVGGGNTRGYRMATYVELMRLRRQHRIVQENMRYGNIYAVDRSIVTAVRHDGRAPVLHTGRLDDLRTMVRSLPGPWTVVALWCSRATAARRSAARSDVDTVDRLKVWDETRAELSDLTSDEISLWIDTDDVSPDDAAAMIDGTLPLDGARSPVGHDGPGLVVPVVTPVDAAGHVDADLVVRYARRLAAWHPSAVPLVAGSYGRGLRLQPGDRRLLAGLWDEVLAHRPVAVAVYDATEAMRVVELGRWPLFVPAAGSSPRSLAGCLGHLLPHVWIYSRAGRSALDPGAAADLAPRGLKVAKCGLDDLASLRAAVGPHCDLWHATARDPAGSRAHGANSVVAACLADLPDPAPPPGSLRGISRTAARALGRLDALGTHDRRVAALERSVSVQLAGG